MSDYYRYENQEKRKGNGVGWMVATMVLVAFLAGALVMKYLPNGNSAGAMLTATAAPGATPTAETAAPTPTPAPAPIIGGSNSLAIGQGIDIPAIVRANGPAVVGVVNKVQSRRPNSTAEATQGTGSGVIILAEGDTGYIVTNNHVVDGADSVTVVLPGGKEVEAEVWGQDAQTDLAVLKIEEPDLTVIPVGDSDALQVGETVIAIGNPLGLELSGTVTAGILSAKNRNIQIDGYNFKLLQTDAAINPGNSGGALVNTKGELIGINSSKSTLAGLDRYGNPIAAEGIGFAIPINEARPIIERLIQERGIQRPILGISPRDITSDEADYYKVPVGVGILALSENGPAMKAGLRAGDVIIEFDGRKVETLAEIRDSMNLLKVGDTVKVKVFRSTQNKELTFDVTLGSSTDVN